MSSSEPWKRPGTDETWVLNALAKHLLFSKEAQSARRVSAR
jgi:hypothetical protein